MIYMYVNEWCSFQRTIVHAQLTCILTLLLLVVTGDGHVSNFGSR